MSVTVPAPVATATADDKAERDGEKSPASPRKGGDDAYFAAMRQSDSPSDSAFLNVGSAKENGREKLRSNRSRPLVVADSLSTYFSADGEPLSSLRTMSKTPNKPDAPFGSSSSIANSASNSSVGTSHSGIRTPGRDGSSSPLDGGIVPSWQSDVSIISRLTTPAATPRMTLDLKEIKKTHSTLGLELPTYPVGGQGSISYSDDNTPHQVANSQRSIESNGISLSPKVRICGPLSN